MTDSYHEEHFTFNAEGYRLPAALTMPEGQEVQWAIVLVPGSMSNDVDGNYPGTPMQPHLYADLARQLAAQGHAVLRYAKYGAGTGAEISDEQLVRTQRVFPRQRVIAETAISKLRELVSQTRGLAIAGHSEGSVHGMQIAQQPGIDAFISLSGPALHYLDLFIHKAQELSKEQGEIIDFGAFQVNAAHYIRVFELLRTGEPFTQEIKDDPTMEFFVKNWDSDTPQAQEGKRYMLDYDAIDPCLEISKVPCPVLIVQGGKDDSGVHAGNGAMLYQARHALHPETTQLAFFPDLQHFYKRVPPDLPAQATMMLTGESDPAVSEAISAWLEGLR